MLEGSRFAARVQERLSALDIHGLRRTLCPPAGIDLSSNDYLNHSADPRVVAGFTAAAGREGVGSTGSRLLRGDRAIFESLESRFARFKGSDRSLFFSSGYLANLAVLTALPEADDVIFSDALNHASLIDGARLSRARTVVAPHHDIDALARLVRETPCDGVRFVVIESLYSMDGDVSRLVEYLALCRAAQAVLVVDEAHAVGIYGASGSGLLEEAGVDANACVSVNTAGKALGVSGAFVAGPSWVIELLVQRARPFVFSTAATPAVAGAIDASLTIVAGEPERRARLRARAAYLRDRLRGAGVAVPAGISQIIPIVVGDNERAVAISRSIQAQGFDARAIRPPSVPPGTSRLRVSVNAALAEQTLDRFVDAVRGALA
jgi:8-amino-7-oxononanoate synthase